MPPRYTLDSIIALQLRILKASWKSAMSGRIGGESWWQKSDIWNRTIFNASLSRVYVNLPEIFGLGRTQIGQGLTLETGHLCAHKWSKTYRQWFYKGFLSFTPAVINCW